jgi:Mg2+-importing ATPase
VIAGLAGRIADLGEVVSLRIGAIVPADLRVLQADELECDEGLLTGESIPVAKSAAATAGG